MSARCATTALDGRRCVRPAGHHEKHMLTQRNVDRATGMRIAEAWGLSRSTTLDAMMDSLFSRGHPTADGLLSVLEIAATMAPIFGRRH